MRSIPKRRSNNSTSTSQKRSKPSTSKVIHVKHCSDEKLLREHIGQPGLVSQVIPLKRMNQALVEMENVQAAQAVLRYVKQNPLAVGNKEVVFEYSSHQQLGAGEEDEKKVIYVQFTGLQKEVTVKDVKNHFARFGAVDRVACFTKKNVFSALVEMRTSSAAEKAISARDGTAYRGATLSVEFAKSQTVKIDNNNELHKDFTKERDSSIPATKSNEVAPAADQGQRVLYVGNIDSRVTPQVLFTLMGLYGNVLRVRILAKEKATALVEFENHLGAVVGLQNLDHRELFGKRMTVKVSSHRTLSASSVEGEAFEDFTKSEHHRYPQRSSCPSQTLCFTGIPEDRETFDASEMNVLLMNYKDIAVRFFDSKPDMCLVRFNSLEEAIDALLEFHGREVFGKKVSVAFSILDME